MTKRTALYERHLAAGARMVDFAGWDMPLHYGSQIEEHHAVRRAAGMFDVSHMTIVDVSGPDSETYLGRLLANDVGKLRLPGEGLYSCMLNHDGGVVDDLIVYRRDAGVFRVVVNAATREADLTWMREVAGDDGVTLETRDDRIMLAVQGPGARDRAAPLLPAALRADTLALTAFHSVESQGMFIARTGYSGEDGWELILEREAGFAIWEALLADGVAACGLGARDTLRLEAGLHLYGQDMDTLVSPLECGLAWTVAWSPDDRAFNGRPALERQRAAGVSQKLVGLLLEDRGIMRTGQPVHTDCGEGLVTSGGFSPTLQRTIALARVPADSGDRCTVEIRNTRRPARMVRPQFVRYGQILIKESSDD